MKKTQKLLLLMAVLLMVIGMLNAEKTYHIYAGVQGDLGGFEPVLQQWKSKIHYDNGDTEGIVQHEFKWVNGDLIIDVSVTVGNSEEPEELFGYYVITKPALPDIGYWWIGDANDKTIFEGIPIGNGFSWAYKDGEYWVVACAQLAKVGWESPDNYNYWTIHALVCETQNPIAGAEVWYDAGDGSGHKKLGVTDDNGNFYIFNKANVQVGGTEIILGDHGAAYPGPGTYYLTHDDYEFDEIQQVVQTGNNIDYNWSSNICGGENHVPVELSSFTATISAQNNVALTWVTETETGMRGYYVHRAEINNLANALIVSPLIASSNSSQQHTYHYEDADLQDSGTYYYWLEANDLNGSSTFHGPVSVLFNAAGENPSPKIPLVTQLHSVYPNPFNPMAFIPFSLAKDSAVDFKIYNSRGQLVKQFDMGVKAAGMHRISWDGTDYNGNILSNGVYNIVMNAGKDSYQTKAVLLK